MLETKLILVEGLPGSGKTTTARLIKEVLEEKYFPTLLFLEGDYEHPADYESFSFFTEEEFSKLLKNFHQYETKLLNHAEQRLDGYVLSRGSLRKELGDSKLPDSLQKALWEHDIYELPLDKNIELITDRWKSFSKHALNSEKTYIFECCFMQNPITMAMIKYGASEEQSMNYVKKLAAIIEPLNPILIYVDQQDLQKSFYRAIEERPKEWSSGFIEYYNNQGYGKQTGAEGKEGTLAVLEARRHLELLIYETLKMEKIKIDNTEYDLKKHKDELEEMLSGNLLTK